MDPPAGWMSFPSDSRWELLFRHERIGDGAGGWYRMTSDGVVTETRLPDNATSCLMAPDGSRALLTGHSSFYEGDYGLWQVARSIVDFPAGLARPVKFAVSWSAWSPDGSKLAYERSTGGVERREESTLILLDVGSGLVRETSTPSLRGLRWRPDGRGLLAAVGLTRTSLARFSADDLAHEGEMDLPLAPEDNFLGMGISPDLESVLFSRDRDWDEDDGDSLFLLDLSDGRTTRIGPLSFDSAPTWSPDSRRLAWEDHGTLMTFDRTTGATTEVAELNPGDESGEINGSHLAWSTDGGLLAFTSFVEDGWAILIWDASPGTLARVLQTDGIVHSLGFISSAR